MSSVREVSDAYLNHLVRILPATRGVCRTCWSVAEPPYDRCYPCAAHLRSATEAGVTLADVVAPIALAVKGEQLAHELWHYKNAPNPRTRRLLTWQLAAVLWRFLAEHEACVASAAGISRFDAVTTVPSSAGRTGAHPLTTMVGRLVHLTRPRYVDLLTPNPAASPDRVLRFDRFTVSGSVRDAAVLLVDDTWTTGAHVQSAATALKAAGAKKVGVVVIGRHFDRGYRNDNRYYLQARKEAFSWQTCCLER